jgi:serine/threonine protein kinase
VTEEMSSAVFETVPGGQIAGYQIEAEIGRGGMAIVYRALDLKLGRQVALKILAPRLAQDESFRLRFIHESQAAAAVDHPHIVPVFEAGEADGALFIAMRYVGTGDVRSLLERAGRLPVARAVTIMSQVASALDAAHARGLVHRDIKPANMLLAEAADGRADHVYLSDFGLSKQSLAPTGLTSTGQFLGTLDYVAPEQIEGRPVDGRADLYALACATVEMLTGAPPFRREENLALMWAQLSEPPPTMTERRPDLPPAIDQVIGKALAKSPDDRYRTCMDFAAALHTACAAQPAEPQARPARRPATELSYLPPVTPPVTPPVAPTSADPEATTGLPAIRPDSAPPRPWSASEPRSRARPGSSAAPPESAAQLGSAAQQAWAAQLGPAGPAPTEGQREAESAWEAAGWRDSGGSRGSAGSRSTPVSPPGMSGPPASAGWPGPGAEDSWAPSGTPGSWLAGQTTPPGSTLQARRPGRRRGAGLAIAAGVIVLVCLAALGFKLMRHHGTANGQAAIVKSTPSVGTSATTGPAVVTPAQTVQAYFRAINHHHYRRAWLLGGKNTTTQGYTSYVSGYSETARDSVHIVSTSGDVVTAQLTADQTDGTVKTFAGTYTVAGGEIVQSHVVPTS